jgi:ATP-binding cassette subfamily C protein
MNAAWTQQQGRPAARADAATKHPPISIGDAFRATRSYFGHAALFSLAINCLYLASPLYMLQVYDRVISSGSVVTLVMLSLVLVASIIALAGLDMVRAQVLTRASVKLDRMLGSRVIAATLESGAGTATRSQPLRDFDNFRQFVTGSGIHAFFDLPWAPIYIGVIFLLHPWLGAFACASATVLIILALANEALVRRPLKEANELAAQNYNFTEMSLRNSEVVRAMGMLEGLLGRWSRERSGVLVRQTQASDRAAFMSSLIRLLRLLMQSLILGLGAYLVLERQATAGAMFAAGLLLSRGLQPVEQIVGTWRQFISAQGAFGRVRRLLESSENRGGALKLPRPKGTISVKNLNFALPETPTLLLRGISFQLEAGEALGIIGPSGAGKSTLARQIVGILSPTSGAVRLDGADVSIWPRDDLGRYVGYLPQDIELFADSVAANISRFRAGADGDVIEAARLAGVHDMILRLPNGYDTQVGEGGAVLSGGYRQRIALARAVFGIPSLVVLDEPSSNLDSEGDDALNRCAIALKRLGSTVVIVSHRPATLGAVDKILFLRDGAVEMYGSRSEVVAQLNQRPKSMQAGSEVLAAGARA